MVTNELQDQRVKNKIPGWNITQVYEQLQTCAEGLTQEGAEDRLKQFGLNRLQEIKGKPLYLKFFANFTHLMAILLWAGGLVAIIARMPQLAIAVWMVNVINGIFSIWQEFRAEKATEALRQMLPTYVRVLRDGVEKRILAEELVPGDVIFLAEGENISADCRLVEQAQFRVDQSTLTGESRPVSKTTDPIYQESMTYTELPNLVFAGTSVAAGTAKAVVFATAMNTEFGKIATLTQSMQEELSPLQLEMRTVTKVVTLIAVLVGVVFFILAAVLAGVNLAESFIFSLGMIVAFVPEGLLPTVTLALAMGTQRMAKRHALIKKLSSVETLGCTTVICTDKTGTLTQNEMTVRQIWLPDFQSNSNVIEGIKMSVSGVGYDPEGQIMRNGSVVLPESEESLQTLLRAVVLCNNSRLISPDSTDQSGQTEPHWSIIGDPTEGALKVLALKGGISIQEVEGQCPRLFEIPFDSHRKRMSTIHLAQDGCAGTAVSFYGQRPRIALVKGAPKEVMELCTWSHAGNNEYSISEPMRAAIMDANDSFAREGLRVLAVAKRILPHDIAEYTTENVEKDLVFLGLVAMMDPPRVEVSEAMEKCHNAGIRIVMITGDYGLTAESIARRVGIIRTRQARIITGYELDSLGDEELKKILETEVIFARVAPEHKLRVVTALQEMGHIAAVTGDGVNDAPALKKANIGVAMGISGSDVAKEAASMILTDDNFASIVNAVEEGRAVYDNIKKFTTYIFTSNTPEAVPFILFAFSAARIPLALNVMHILAVDLGTDIVPALALGSEPPEPGVMRRPPRDIQEHVINLTLLTRAYAWLGMIQSIATMAAFYYMYWMNGYYSQWLDLPGTGDLYRSATGMALAAVVVTQIGNLFAQRTERISSFRLPLFQNKIIWIGIITEIALVFLIIYSPFLQKFIGTNDFPLSYWLFLLPWVPSLLLADELRKWWVRKRAEQLEK